MSRQVRSGRKDCCRYCYKRISGEENCWWCRGKPAPTGGLFGVFWKACFCGKTVGGVFESVFGQSRLLKVLWEACLGREDGRCCGKPVSAGILLEVLWEASSGREHC